jgi:nicotinamidase-related amidase
MPNRERSESLITDADDSVLAIIDVQQEFLDKLDNHQQTLIVNRIGWIVEMAGRLNIPMVVTAEDTDTKKGTVQQIVDKLPQGIKAFNKMSYGLTGDEEILHAIEATGRNTVVLVGLETDVCICQSALGLLEKGYRVVVLEDAVASPPPCHDQGIERMRDAGVIISSVKGTFYEWQRNVECGDSIFADIYKKQPPEGVYL